MVDQRLTQITPPAATPDQLRQHMEAAWSAVPQERIQSLFESKPRRVAAGQLSDFGSLGLARISGILSAEKCIELLEEKLAKHKLTLHTDVAAIMTNGASVMKKMGRMLMMCSWRLLMHFMSWKMN
ncbi:hypothetical protein TNCV_5013261 [Trichonephila clavipes]|nr:hypothetical protein TNCV_5013261 [Trichonephila clavipes]